MSTNPDEVDWDYVYERNRRIWLGLDSAPEEGKISDHDHDHDDTIMEQENANYTKHTNKRIDNDLEEVGKAEQSSNTLKGMPFLPKNLGTPKNVIPQWYERHHKGFAFRSNDCFFSWNDNGKAHEMYWTSIFKCPVTGELFGSGQFGDDRSSYQIRRELINGVANENDDGKVDGKNEVEDVKDVEEELEGEQKVDECNSGVGKKVAIVWHRKKKDAEHAAAARALDCLSFRDGGGVSSMCYGLCREDPYLDEQGEMDDDDDDGNTEVVKKFAIPSSVPPTVFDWLMTESGGIPMQIEKH
mmetsp:Transcript_10769/g.13616  ORF Transcript_10769/g.13616 Transcript_10769/m.13616 type:complete len:299 (+) Transcript_10769:59-955(+)